MVSMHDPPGRLHHWRKGMLEHHLKCATQHLAVDYWETVAWSGEEMDIIPRSIMVWGCFSSHGTCRIRIIKGKVNRVMCWSLSRYKSVAIHQDDKDETKVDISSRTMIQTNLQRSWFQGWKIKGLDWPSQSPDFNSIEPKITSRPSTPWISKI